MKNGLKAAAVFAVAAAFSPMAEAQYSGVSHPDSVPVQMKPEMATQPEGYVSTPVPATARTAPTLQTRPEDGMVVGSPGPVRLDSGAGPTIAAARTEGTRTERDDSAAMRAQDRGFVGEASRPDVDAQIVTRVDGPANELPVGTVLKARLQERLSTTSTEPGNEFHAELTEPVEREGRVLLPAGAMLTGRVTNIFGGKRISGPAYIHLQAMAVTMPDGMKYRIQARVIDTSIYDSTKVADDGSILRKDHAGKTLAVMGLAAGSGAAAGGLIAGAPGAVVGAAVGAGVGTTVWLKQDHQMEIPAETKIVFALNQALVVGPE